MVHSRAWSTHHEQHHLHHWIGRGDYCRFGFFRVPLTEGSAAPGFALHAGARCMSARGCGALPPPGRAPRVHVPVMERFSEITEPAIAALVARFYARARRDPLIGPVFNDAVDDWDAHLRTLNAFWSSVMLTSGRYKGNPMAAHLEIADRTAVLRALAGAVARDRGRAVRARSRARGSRQRPSASPRASSSRCSTGPAPSRAPECRHDRGDRIPRIGAVRTACRSACRAGRVSPHADLRRGHDPGRAAPRAPHGSRRLGSDYGRRGTIAVPHALSGRRDGADAGTPIAVAPQQPHEVAPDGPVRFYVEFYRAADAGSPASSQA